MLKFRIFTCPILSQDNESRRVPVDQQRSPKNRTSGVGSRSAAMVAPNGEVGVSSLKFHSAYRSRSTTPIPRLHQHLPGTALDFYGDCGEARIWS